MTANPPRTLVWIDGEPAGDTPRVSVFDRGFLYGDSVFETLRTYGGEPFALEAHLARLQESALRVGIPWTGSLGSLALEVRSAVKDAGWEESYVRVMVTRGEGALGLVPTGDLAPKRVIIVAPLSPPPGELYQQGASAISFTVEPRFGLRELAGAKIGNYLIGILALEKARAAEAHEALFVDRGGIVNEGATSNLFFVQDGVLHTPGESDGILPGITRASVLSLVELLGLPVVLKSPTLDVLCSCDEVFVTSTLREILPIVRIDARLIGDGRPGKLARDLLMAFRSHARTESIRARGASVR